MGYNGYGVAEYTPEEDTEFKKGQEVLGRLDIWHGNGNGNRDIECHTTRGKKKQYTRIPISLRRQSQLLYLLTVLVSRSSHSARVVLMVNPWVVHKRCELPCCPNVSTIHVVFLSSGGMSLYPVLKCVFP